MNPSTTVQRAERPSGIQRLRPEEMINEMTKKFGAIASRAFQIFENNGWQLGHDLENWFQAESELFHPLHLDVAEADNMLTVKAEIPGFTEKDIQISLEPRRLTITGKRETREEKKDKKTLYTERCSNEIFRVVDLPQEVDPSASGVKATYDQGVLTVTLPEVPSAKGREIKIEPK
jgi:HSP20 family protein